MRSQGLSDVRAGTCDLDDNREHIPDAPTWTAVACGHPQVEQTGRSQPTHRLVLQHAIAFGGGVTVTQVVEDGGHAAQAVGHRTAQRLLRIGLRFGSFSGRRHEFTR